MDVLCHRAPQGEINRKVATSARRRCMAAGWRNGLWVVVWDDGTTAEYRIDHERPAYENESGRLYEY